MQEKGSAFFLGILGAVCLGVIGCGMGWLGGKPAGALTYQDKTDVLFTVNPTINLSVSGDLVIDNLTPNNSADSNTITVTASSNAPVGYTLYTNVGDSSNNYTDLRLSGSDSTNVFGVLPSAVASLANMGDSKWGYSYCNNSNDCTSSSNWVQGSTGSTSVGYGIMPLYNDASHSGDIKLADTNNSSETTINFKIGAKASAMQAAGTYTNVINFINVPKVITTNYTLNYTDNSGTATGTLPATTGTTTDGTFTISTSRPTSTNTDYIFRGWCTENNSSDVTACSGNLLFPGDLYVINSSSANWSSTVYAVWQDNTPAPSKLYMQDIASWKDTTLPNIGDETIAYDARDEKPYYVAKLPDGNIWMTQNLDFDIVNGGAGLNSTNTDVPANWADAGNLTNTYAAGTTAWNASHTASESYDAGDLCWNGTVDDTWSGGQQVACSKPNHYHLGNYYNWTVAVAMQNSSSYTAGNTDVNQSICPAGWMLPKKTGDGSFYNLIDSRYTSGTNGNIHLSPSYFVYGGYFGGGLLDVGSNGSYWSSVVNDSGFAYDLFFDAGEDLYPQDYVSRGFGLSIRCLAR